jgi:hypothetical protein
MRYFSGRRAWLVEPDLPAPVVRPYQDDPTHQMEFVQIGAPGIEALRSPDDVRRKVLEKVNAPAGSLFSCDIWNYYFTAVTGVRGPGPDTGCFGRDRGDPVSFEHWFSWLQTKRER